MVVREWFAGERMLVVERVDEDDAGNVSLRGETEFMRCWFLTRGEDYEYLHYTADTLGESAPVQPAFRIGLHWYVQQAPARWETLPPDSVPHPPTDCQVAV